MGEVAIIGGGVVAAYVAAAVKDAGMQPVIYTGEKEGRVKPPPPGAFYLHSVPERYRLYPAHTHLELVAGMSPETYTERMWGQYRPSSIENIRYAGADRGVPGVEEVLMGMGHGYDTRRLRLLQAIQVWRNTPELLDAMTEGAIWFTGSFVTRSDITYLQDAYPKVIVTAPIRLTEEDDKETQIQVKVKMMPVLQLTESDVRSLPRWKSWVDDLPHGLRWMLYHLMRELISRDADPGLALTGDRTLYSANEDDIWLRATKIQGHISLEIVPGREEEALQALNVVTGRNRLVMVPKIAPVDDPLILKAPDAIADKVLLTGRWATLDRGELSHQSYDRTAAFLRGE